MLLGPVIDMTAPDPLSDILRSFGGGLAKGIGQSQENQMLQQAMAGVNTSDPKEIMAMMQRANPILRPQILALLKQQQEAMSLPQSYQRKEVDYQRGVQKDIADINYRRAQTDALQNKPVPKSYVGLKQGDLNTISNDVKNAIDSGVDPRVVENVIKTSGLNTNDIEAVMSTNFSNVKRLLNGIKSPSRKQVPGMPGVVGGLQSLTEKDISQSVNIVSKAIQVGGSLDYIYSGLIEKGYKPIDAQNIVRQAAIGAKLTDRQQLQLSNLEASRQGLLGRIFGEVLEPTGV